MRHRPSKPSTEWSVEQLQDDLRASADIFRKERMEEPLEAYLEEFEGFQEVMENLLDETDDLSLLSSQAAAILSDRHKLDGFRYLAGPPISLDDLKTLAEDSITPANLRNKPELVQRLLDIMRTGLDRRRFPWVSEEREPTQAERDAAIIASAALMATQKVATSRRNESKKRQEARVAEALRGHGLTEVPLHGGHIATTSDAPPPGSFCASEILFGDRKADLFVRLWDGRLMPIECKVSNSALNSVKRLNNDAAVKATSWIRDFGQTQVVPVAVLSGVYAVTNLQNAQSRGLVLYWAHRLDDLTEWIEGTRQA